MRVKYAHRKSHRIIRKILKYLVIGSKLLISKQSKEQMINLDCSFTWTIQVNHINPGGIDKVLSMPPVIAYSVVFKVILSILTIYNPIF